MIGGGSLLLGLVMGVVFIAWAVGRLRRSEADPAGEYESEFTEQDTTNWETDPEKRRSWDRHRDAQGRTPPVEIGDIHTLGIEEFTPHHSGAQRAVGRIEGFVVFVDDVPESVAVTDVIRVKILSFNRGHTSATATFVERV